jgi:hypothetical protein
LENLVPNLKINNTIADFDSLVGEEPHYDDIVRYNDELYSGYLIEFDEGVFEALYYYYEGHHETYSTWNKEGVLTTFQLGSNKTWCKYSLGFNGSNSTYSYRFPGGFLNLGFPEIMDPSFRIEATSKLYYTEINILNNPFLYSNEINKSIGLGESVSIKMFKFIPLFHTLVLVGSGITAAIVHSLIENSSWCNVREVSFSHAIISKEVVYDILSVYPKVKVLYVE